MDGHSEFGLLRTFLSMREESDSQSPSKKETGEAEHDGAWGCGQRGLRVQVKVVSA